MEREEGHMMSYLASVAPLDILKKRDVRPDVGGKFLSCCSNLFREDSDLVSPNCQPQGMAKMAPEG